MSFATTKLTQNLYGHLCLDLLYTFPELNFIPGLPGFLYFYIYKWHGCPTYCDNSNNLYIYIIYNMWTYIML